MKSLIEKIDLGLIPYREAWAFQKTKFEELISSKKNKTEGKELLIFAEHYPVITMGRHAKESNVLISEKQAEKEKIEIIKIERGGDVTFHGLGQMVVYPILDLQKHKLGVKDYVNLLEESVIRTLNFYGIKGERVTDAPGVWIDKGSDKERKICALGIKCSRYCSMHGLALNVNTDLNYFSLLNPCGFIDKGVTSMKMETGRWININDVKEKFSDIFFGLIFPL